MNLRRLLIPLGALFFFGSCFDVASKTCSTGLVCPVGTVCSGDGTNCISASALCGNGVKEGDEKCDDGNIVNGDSCRFDCRGTGECGDGTLDAELLDAQGQPLEVCDDGNKIAGDGCNPQCKREVCGNGIVDVIADGGTEPCDDGNSTVGDGCRANCTREVCGDGERDNLPDGGREQCDDGNTLSGDDCSSTCFLELCNNDPDGGMDVIDVLRDGGLEECDNDSSACSATCRIVRCGNGDRENATSGRGQGNELCDDGNRDGGDGCNADCTGVEVCGDGKRDAVLMDGGFEVCDDNNRDGGDGCSADCRSDESCGNAITDFAAGELCDDMNRVSGDGCRNDCKGVEVCGDGVRDVVLVDAGTEQCDDDNLDAGDGCSPTCRFEVCGNGITDPNELCDDGNTDPISANPDGGVGDNCSSDCRSTGTCGNGTVESGLGEQCDNGVANGDNAACTAGCQIARCGDSKVRTGVEDCDTGGESPTCNVNCTNRRCGDGIINASAGEQCDVFGAVTGTETATCDTDCTVAFCGDSKVNLVLTEQCDTGGNTNTCNANCRPAVCGDSILNTQHGTGPDGGAPFEQCDTGGNTNFCDNDCSPAVCGDGLFNSAAGEQCDDGNSTNTDDCVSGCRTNACGDGFRDQQGPSTEACDDGNTVAETTCAYGLQTCTGCAANCGSVLNLNGPYCGDNSVNGPEVCDDGNTTTESQCAYGLGSCTACTANCGAQFSLTGPRCGDGVVNGSGPDLEVCDDGNTTTETACPYGVTGTCTRCDETCDTSLALTGPFCGDGVVNGTETCDDRNAFSCGTCNASCTNNQPPLEASGSIRVIGPADMADGQTVTINDGINPPVVFVIKKTPGFDAGTRVPVDMVSVANSIQTNDSAFAFIAAINGLDAGSFLIAATYNSNNPRVRLRHDQLGSVGNQPMSETVANPTFNVFGMTGGGGFDCDAGVGCLQSADCRSGTCTLPADGGTLGTCD